MRIYMLLPSKYDRLWEVKVEANLNFQVEARPTLRLEVQVEVNLEVQVEAQTTPLGRDFYTSSAFHDAT